MIVANIFDTLKANAAVTAILGTKPLRVYPYSEAPQQVSAPYMTYGTIAGTPENYINQAPDVDRHLTQIDIWCDTVAQANAAYTAVRNCLEAIGHVQNFQSITRDPETKRYNARFEIDFLEYR